MTKTALELEGIYNVPVLLEHSVGDKDFAVELLERFHSRLGTIGKSLQEHVRSGDFQQASRTAHSLKGESGIMAADRLYAVAARLEESLQSTAGTQTTELLDQVADAIEQCLAADSAVRETLSQIQAEQP